MFKKICLLLSMVLIIGVFAGCTKAEPPAGGDDGTVEPTLVLADETFGEEFYAIGFRPGDVAFINEVNRALNELIADGTAAQISEKWFGDDIVYKPANTAAPTPAADDNSWKEIQDKGKFVLGLDDEFPPMGFVNESGETVGFDIDLAKAVAEKLGIEVVIQPIAWDSKELELKTKNIDCVWNGLTMSQERLDSGEWGFSQPYLENTQVIIAWSDSEIKTIANLAGKKVGAQIDSSGYDAVMSNEEAVASFDGDVLTFDTYLTALMDLKGRNIDAVVGDEILVKYYMQKDAE